MPISQGEENPAQWLVVCSTDRQWAILPPLFCLEISGTLPDGNFISRLKYMTQAVD
ncbi:hypothetical protein [Pseudomonas uvaldensis]|uniref:hypothetical protein n=1 Tax=Pseudomonas uvaldensis TaxID=2878385 RepID=UPI001E4D735F|nr:hypothetical protein [Pseudomonas uvaldensis]MCE0464016.1 hypothetical protein [Pseudomonas uvaldensis]